MAYNLTIGNVHTYYVIVGEVPVLVHNTPCIKPVNLPSWRTVKVDMVEVLSGHTVGGSRVSPLKTLFPENMSASQIERAVRQAYRYSSRIGGSGNRIQLQGQYNGITIRLWLNRETRVIETAYPAP